MVLNTFHKMTTMHFRSTQEVQELNVSNLSVILGVCRHVFMNTKIGKKSWCILLKMRRLMVCIELF